MERTTTSNSCLPNLVLRKLYKGGLLRRRHKDGKHPVYDAGRTNGQGFRILDKNRGTLLYGPGTTCTAYVMVALVCFLCYHNSLHGDLVHDDLMAITRNPDVRPSSSLYDLWSHDFWGTPIRQNNSHKSYRPLTVLTFRINYAVGGLDPFGYHVVNVMLHTTNTLLLMLVCLWMLKLPLPTAVLAALLFATHPVHTEAVSGVVGRAELLSACFFLTSIIAFNKSIQIHHNKKNQCPDTKNCRLLALSVCLSGAAMLAKEQGIMGIPVCLAFDILIFSRHAIHKCFQKPYSLPLQFIHRFVALSISLIGLLCLRFHIMGWSTPQFKPEDNPAAFASSFITRAMTYSHLYVFNMVLLLHPSKLSYDWQMGSIPLLQHLSDIRNLASLSLFISLILIARYSLQSRKVVKSSSGHVVASRLPATVGLVLLVLPFLPASNIISPVGFVVAERVLYMPSMGFVLLLAHVVEVCWSRAGSGSRQQRALVMTCLLLCGMWTSRTLERNNAWSSREALFRSGLEALPHNAKMHYNWGNWLKDAGNKTAAAYHYETAIQLWPNYSSAYNNLGTVTVDTKQAEEFYRKAITISPNHAGAYFNLGNLLSGTGRVPEAEGALREAIRLDPQFADPYTSLAVLLEEQERHEEAEACYRTAIQLRPQDPNLHNNIAVFLANNGHHHEAIDHYSSALKEDSKHHIALLNAAKLHKQLKNYQEAARHFERALEMNEDIGTLEEAAIFFFNNNKTKRAISLFRKLLRKEPQNIKYKLYYAQMISRDGRLQDAERIYRHVLAVETENTEAMYQLSKLYGLLKKHEAAIKLLNRVAQLITDDFSFLGLVHFELGNHHKDSGLMQSAFQHYLKSVEFNPSISDAHLNLGVFFHIKGEAHLAEKHYKEAQEHSPNNALIQDNLEKLHKRLDISLVPSIT